MPEPRHKRSHRQKLVLWLAVLSLLLAGTVWGLYAIYSFRKKQNTQNLLAQARSAADAEDWVRAATAYRHYLQRELDDADALQAYANVLLKRIETTPEAVGDTIHVLRRVVGLQPANTNAMGELTRLYLAVQDYAMAKQSASNWVRLAPNAAGPILALATAQYRLDKRRENSRAVRDTLIDALTRNPDQAELYPLLIHVLDVALDNREDAANRLNDALSVGPENAGVQMAAFAFKRKMKVDEAEDHLRKALRLAPDSLSTRLAAGEFYVMHDRLDEAAEQLDHARRIAPRSLVVLTSRRDWAIRTARPADLVAVADDYFEVANESRPGLLAMAAELYLGAGELERTDDCLEKIDALPAIADEQKRDTVARVRGTRAFQEGDYSAAIRHLRSATVSPTPNMQALRLSATAHAQLGNLDGAMENYKRIVELPRGENDGGFQTDAQLKLAELEWTSGRFVRARKTLETILKPNDAQRYRIDLIRLACDLAPNSRTATEHASSVQELDRLASNAAPRGPFVTRWLVRCFALTSQHERAFELFVASLGNAKAPPSIGLELGQLFVSDGRHEHLVTLAAAVLKQFPSAPQGHVLRVRAIAATEGLAQARAYVESNEWPDPTRANILESLAGEYVAGEQTEAAIALYRESADLMPNILSTRRMLVRLTSDLDEALLRSNEIRVIEGDGGVQWKFEEARARLRLRPEGKSLARAGTLLKACLGTRRGWLAARLLLAHAKEIGGDLRGAADDFRMALSQDTTLQGKPVAAHLVELLYQLDRVAEGDALLDSLFQASPDNPAILRLRVKQQIRRKEFASALAAAEEVLAYQRDNTAEAIVTADLHLRVGNPIRAEEIAREHIERSPQSTTLLWVLARSLINQHRQEEALQQVRDAAIAFDDAQHHVLLARLLSRMNRRAEAEQAIQQAQVLAKNDAPIWAVCASLWGSLGQRSRQLASMRKSVELSGNDPVYSLILARVLAETDNSTARDEARRIVNQLIASNPQHAEAFIVRGRLTMLSSRPNPSDAEADFQKAVSINPRLADAYRLLGQVQRETDRPRAARESIDRGLARARRDPGLLLASAELHVMTGDHEEAIRQLKTLLKDQPHQPDALRLLCRAYRDSDQIDQGIAFLDAYSPHEARNANEMVLLAELHESNQDHDRAGELFQQATAIDPASNTSHRSRLRFLARQKDLEGIRSLAMNRRQRSPNDVRSWAMAAEMLGSQKVNAELRQVGMGWLEDIAQAHDDHAADATHRAAVCHLLHDELRDAETKFLAAQRLAPANGDIVNNLAWLYSEYLDEPAKATDLIEAFLASGGREDAHLLDTHCVALLRLKRFDAAEQKARQCLRIARLETTQTAATYHLALALMGRDKTEEARASFRKAGRLDDRNGGLTASERQALRQRLEATPPAPNPDGR